MIRNTGLATLALLCAVAAAHAQRPDRPPKADPTWPELDKKQRAAGERWIQLLKSPKDAVRTKAIDNLVVLGVGMGDRLFRRMTDSPHRQINDQLAHVLDQILRPEHAPLIALHARHKSLFARRYVMKLLCKFARKESVSAFKKGRKDKDVEVAYYAALGLVRTVKDLAALDAVFERCLEEWGELCDEVTRNLTPVRSPEFIPWIRKKLLETDVQRRVTTLRLMRSIAPPQARSYIRPCLDSEESILKKESINTLRVIVDGKKPLEKITVFMVINMAKKWRKRL